MEGGGGCDQRARAEAVQHDGEPATGGRGDGGVERHSCHAAGTDLPELAGREELAGLAGLAGWVHGPAGNERGAHLREQELHH